jgi:Arf-GAP/SH3 domain/ANK repeat/PH domain-containing protein
MKKSLKSIHQSGNSYVESELALSRALEKLGTGALNQEPELGAAFLKFAVVTKEQSNLQKTLVCAQSQSQP